MTRTQPRPVATLPPVSFTPEEAAAIAVALAARPDGPYAPDGRAALEKVLGVLEPDAGQRAELLAAADRHPAGRALGKAARAAPARLVVLPGGLP
jgi:predicted DNA-binding transcriptional regulator YafY